MQAFKTFEGGNDKARHEKFIQVYGYNWAICTTDTKGIYEMDRVNEKIAERQQELADVWKHMPQMDDAQWGTFCSYCRALVAKEGKVVDPLLHDALLLQIWDAYVKEEIRNAIMFKDESGDFFIYDNKLKIWQERDAKNAPAWLFTQMVEECLDLVKKQTFLFSKSSKQKVFELWVQKLCTYGALANLLKLRCKFPNPKIQGLNTKAWMTPLLYDVNYDAQDMKLVQREKEDYFSAHANFWYLSVTNKINTSEQRLELRALLRDESEVKKGTSIVDLLKNMFPNAMQLVTMCFHDFDRLWFMLLRLGMLMSNTCAREILFLYGKGKGGKSSLMFTVLNVLGDLATPMSKQSFVKSKLESSGSSHTTDLCKAAHRRFVLVDELESSDSMKESLLKNWASHQPIAIRELFRKQSQQVMKAYLVFLTNSPPRFSMEDMVIMERVKAVKVTTKFFNEMSRDSERPRNFSPDSWVDQYCEEEDVYWVYQTPEKKEFLKKFDESIYQHELGTLLCALSTITFWYLQFFGDLPYPKIIIHDNDEFFKAGDILEMFMQESCEKVTSYDDATDFMDLLHSFNQFVYKFGQKSFHPGNFKKILQSKNLVYQRKAKNAKLKVKLRLRPVVEVKMNKYN